MLAALNRYTDLDELSVKLTTGQMEALDDILQMTAYFCRRNVKGKDDGMMDGKCMCGDDSKCMKDGMCMDECKCMKDDMCTDNCMCMDGGCMKDGMCMDGCKCSKDDMNGKDMNKG